MKLLRVHISASDLMRVGHYWYFRRGGKNTRIPFDRSSPEFARRYADLLEGRTPAAPKSVRTVGALVASYRRTRAYAALAPRTRADYEKILRHLEAKNGCSGW